MGAARMRRTVLLEVPRVWTRDASLSVDEATQKLVREVFERNAKQLRDGDLEVMTFVIHHAVEKVIESAVLWRPELLDAPAFRHELSHLVLSYVQRSERTPPVGQ